MSYSPNPTVLIPGLQNASPEIRALADYITNELREISKAFSEGDVVESRTVFKEPIRPREGMIAVADGTHWDPGNGAGAYVYVGGVWTFLGDTGGGGGITVTTVTINFTENTSAKFFDVALVGATVGQKVLATVSLNMPAGVDEDELEMDPLVVAGYVTTVDQVRLLVSSSQEEDLIFGQYNINVTLA